VISPSSLSLCLQWLFVGGASGDVASRKMNVFTCTLMNEKLRKQCEQQKRERTMLNRTETRNYFGQGEKGKN
jgi:hypothetical protein